MIEPRDMKAPEKNFIVTRGNRALDGFTKTSCPSKRYRHHKGVLLAPSKSQCDVKNDMALGSSEGQQLRMC